MNTFSNYNKQCLPWISIFIITQLIVGCTDPKPEVLRFGLVSAPLDLDPRRATDAASSRVNRLLYRRLVEFDAANRPVPGLADWVQTSPLVYLFKLRDDPTVRNLPDGKRLTATDVHATLASIQDPDTGSPYRTQIAGIATMHVIDSEQLEIHLHKPDAIFPTRLVLEILPADLLASGHPFHHQPVGSGPFRLLAWPQPGRLSLLRHSDQQVIELVEVKDPGVRVMKLLRGEIDLLQSDLPPELFRFLRQKDTVQVAQCQGSNFTYIGLQMQDPVLAQLPVRQALAHAIDRQSIIRYLLDGGARLAHSLLPPNHWAGADDLPAITYDPQLARQFLAQAGYDEKHPLQLTYKTSTDPFRIRLATVIQAQLREVGIQVQVQSLDWGTFFGDIKSGRFQLYSLTWVGIKTPDHFRAIVHSSAVPPLGSNRGRYHNPAVDQLLDQAAIMPDLTGQAVVYRQLQHLLLQDLPYIPLWYEAQIAAANTAMRGYTPAADGNFDALEQAKLQ